MDKEKDIFSEIIKEKLSNYSLPVDYDSWDKIEERLNYASPGKTKRLWIVALTTAASILLLLSLLQFNKKVYQNETDNQLSDHEETIIQNVSEKTLLHSNLQQTVVPSAVFRKPKSDRRLAENRLTAEVIPEDEIQEEDQFVQSTDESIVQENPLTLHVSDFDFGKETKKPVFRNKKRQSVSLSFGSGKNLLAENNAAAIQGSFRSNSSEYLYSNNVTNRTATQDVVQTRTEEILLNENYPDVIHYPPVSLGVMVKKDLTQAVAIESGIVYTFINTTFSKEFPFKSKADLQLHYIGIPLNIHTRFNANRNSQWGMYLSTGGMVEKGLLSNLVQKSFFNDSDNTVMTVKSSEKINGLQWSVNVSPGVDYQIYKNYSIYLEPKLSYYFDNDQPESARTKHPIVVGVNAGLRYTW